MQRSNDTDFMNKAFPIILAAFLLALPGASVATAQSPVAFYLKNPPCPRIGTDSDEDIIRDLRADGFLVFEIDCVGYPKTSPAFEDRLAAFHLASPAWLKERVPADVKIDFRTIFYVPAGYRVARNIPVWNILKHGPPRIQDYILETYNTAIAKKFKIKPVKTAAEMVARDGGPLDYNMYMDFIYPSGTPREKVPLLLNFASGSPRFSPFSPEGKKEVACRVIFPIGFLISGYAFANLDHCFIPMARTGVYGFVQPYSLDNYTAVAYVTSSIRYIRSVAGKYNLNGRIGTMGISKASYSAVISARIHNDRQPEASTRYGQPAALQPYQGYSSKVEVAYAASGMGTRHIPKLVDADTVPMVVSMGKFDKFTHHWTQFPLILSHLDKVDNNHLGLWMEELGHTYPAIGDDLATGLRRYSLMKTFFDRHLKPEEHTNPEVFYILPKEGEHNVSADGTFRVLPDDAILPKDLGTQSVNAPVTVRFLSAMDVSKIADYLSLVNTQTGKAVFGKWTPTMRNTTFTFASGEKLESGTCYVVKVSKGAPGADGTTLQTATGRRFTVSSATQ